MQNKALLAKFRFVLGLALSMSLSFSLSFGYGQGPELLPQTRNLIHLKSLGIIIHLYAQKHGGKYPESWAELSNSGVAKDLPPDLGELRYESADGKQHLAWLCFPGASTSSPAQRIVAASPLAADDPQVVNLRLVLYADLKVKRVPDAEYQDQLSKQQTARSSR